MASETSSRFKPQFIPYRCPKCNGHGSVDYGRLKCEACKGTGVYKVPVAEADEQEEVKEEHGITS